MKNFEHKLSYRFCILLASVCCMLFAPFAAIAQTGVSLAKPASFSPSGSIGTRTPTYQWYPVSGATQYRLLVLDAAGISKIDTVYSSAAVGCPSMTQSCYADPTVALADGSSTWQVQAQTASVAGPWSDSLTITVAAASPPPPPPAQYSLSVTLSGPGSITSNPAGIKCGSTCSALFDSGKVVVLTAATASGSTFSGWSGACSGTKTSCSVTMSAAKKATARFAAAPALAKPVLNIPSGTVNTRTPTYQWYPVAKATQYHILVKDASGTSKVDAVYSSAAVGCPTMSQSCYVTPPVALADGGATWQVQAQTASASGPWSDSLSITVSVAAPPPPPPPPPPPAQYSLSVNLSGAGVVISAPAGINCGTVCSANFAANTSVGLSATAAAGSSFAGWSGACNGSGACVVSMDQARSVGATFSSNTTGGGSSVVPLTLAAAPAATAIPVKTGVPFAIGSLPSLANARLESGDGSQQIPAQFDTLASWPDGSVKSALVQFVSDVGAARNYRVAYGAGVTRAPVVNSVAVSQANGATTVDTGVIKYVVNAQGLITSLWRDVNQNGQYEVTEQVLGAGEFFMVNAFDGLEYTASQAASPDIAIEEQGPIRAVIRARGSLTAPGGQTLIKYLVRYYAYAGSDKLDIDFTVIDDRPEANTDATISTLAFSAKSYGLRWNYLSDSAATYDFGLESGNFASGTVSAEHYLLQNGAFVFDDGVDKGNSFSYSGVGSGRRAPGWVTLDSGARHLALMVRDFWQQYPIELNIKGNTLSAVLFSDKSLTGNAADTVLPTQSGTIYKRPNSFYFARPGGAKTHQMRFAFGAVQPAVADLNNLNDGYQRHRLELTADPSWYAASGVFGDINVGTSPNAASGYDAMLLQDIYIPSIEKPSVQSAITGDTGDLGEDATMFGWRDYGDRLRAGWNNVVNGVKIPAFYNDTHIGSNNFLHEFVRTGEQRWFQLGEISTRQFADINVSHAPRNGYWETEAAWAAMGQQPAGEVHAMGHNNEDHQVRNLHWGHAHVSGLSDLYLLTGDKRSLEVLTEIAGWWKHVTPYFFKTPFDPGMYREAERDYAWPLYVMNEYVRVTGDSSYHQTVNAQLVNYLIQWWQTPMNHIGYNPATNTISSNVINVNDASKGAGYWTMTLMDNSNGVAGANGVNPWMAGPLLSNLIKFYEQDKLLAASGKGAGIPYATIEDMLFQCMNYLVKYGYDASNDWFVYSEVTRGYTGGHTLIDYPLAYLDRLYKQRYPAGNAWYDTEPSWNVIAKKRYNEFLTVPVGANTQSYGFYGYEMVYPVDFFKIEAGQ